MAQRAGRLLGLAGLGLLAACATPQRQPALPNLQPPALTQARAVMADGYALPLRVWPPEEPPRAVVLALHGFNDYGAAFDRVGPFLARHQVITYAYDQRGFGATDQRGLWPGGRRLDRDARAMLELIAREHPGLPVYLLGESMGAAVAMAALAESPSPPVAGVILVAPAVWSRDSMPWYQRLALELALRIAPGWTPTGESLGRLPTDNLELLRAMARDPLVIKATRIDTVAGLVDLMDRAMSSAGKLELAGLVLYGERDQIIPRGPTCRLLARLPGSWRYARYPEGYHMLLRDLNGDRVLADIAAWVADGDGQLPSGSEVPRDDWGRVCEE